MITVVDTTALAKESGGHLASVDAKLPALSSGAVPVTLPTAQITALTPPTSVSVSNLPTTQAVSGSVAVTGTTAVSAATLPLPTGASTEATLAAVNAKLPALAAGAIPVSLPGTQAISGTVSVSNLLATQPVSGTVTANAGTNLNTSALALETGGNLATIAGRTPALGSAVSASSSPVVIASDQTVPTQGVYTEVSGSGSALNADLIASMDVRNYRWIAVQLTAIGSATAMPQISMDNVTWYNLPLVPANTVVVAAGAGIAALGTFIGPISAHYFRLRLTVWASGTATATVGLFTVPSALHTQGVASVQSGTWTVTNNPAAATTGGATPSHTVSAASTTPTNLKASAGTVYGAAVSNGAAYAVYLKLFNKASAPTPGTDTPIRTILCPAGQFVQVHYPVGLACGTGIGFAITKLLADLDNTALLAGDCAVDIDWK